MVNVGLKIKEQRVKNNLSQKDLAKKLSVSDKLISKWENNLGIPSVEYLIEMSEIFHIDLQELIGENKKRKFKMPSLTEKKKRTLLQALTIFASVFIILGISLLGAYVIVPKSSKNAYIKQVGQYIENNFLENYYNYSLTTTEDGTSKVAYERAYVDETGVNYESVNESGKKIIVKDGIRYNGTNNTKEVFVLETLDVKDVFYEFTKDKIDEEFSLKDIKYIRKLNDGFYLKFDKNLITKELTSSQKKQIKFLTPFEGNILLNGDKLKSITASVVFKFNGEKHKIKSELEFDFVKPSINFSENVLENTPWNTFKTLSDNEIVSNLAGSKNFKEINLQTQDLSNAKVFNDNCYYFVDNTLYVYNLKDEEEITKMDVSSYLEVKTTLSYPVVTYAYKNKVCFYHSSRAYVVDIKLGVLDKVLSAYSDVSSIVCGGNSIISYKTGEFLNLDDLTVQTYSSSSRPMYFDGGWFTTPIIMKSAN